MDDVWWRLMLLMVDLCVTVVAAALEGTAATALFAVGLPAMLAGLVILESARRRR